MLIINDDHLVLFKNQVNAYIQAMTKTIYHCGGKVCRVQFFGIKWSIPDVKTIIDDLVQQYLVTMNVDTVCEKN
jgi:hypothetical protein